MRLRQTLAWYVLLLSGCTSSNSFVQHQESTVVHEELNPAEEVYESLQGNAFYYYDVGNLHLMMHREGETLEIAVRHGIPAPQMSPEHMEQRAMVSDVQEVYIRMEDHPPYGSVDESAFCIVSERDICEPIEHTGALYHRAVELLHNRYEDATSQDSDATLRQLLLEVYTTR